MLEPVRLLELATVSGIPREATAAATESRSGRSGRHRLGASLLGLGSRVSPERRLRITARRPIAELTTDTGAAVHLSAVIAGDPLTWTRSMLEFRSQ